MILLIYYTVYILRVSLSIESGISTTTGKDWAAMEFGRGCVKDLKFLDDDTMLVLWNSAGKYTSIMINYPHSNHGTEETCIFAIPYNGSPNSINSESGEMMRYTPETAAISEAPPMSFRQENTLKLFPKYNISTSNTFVPDRIKVRALDEQKKGDAPRIVIVSEDRLQYQVLELTVPSPAQDKRDGADDVKMV
jgi:anaphase-promoting complex subunit 4